MSNRTTECYAAVLNFIESNVFELKPTAIITDFEAGMRKAIKTVYKDVVLRGCWFHYCQAIKKMALKLGLRNELRMIQEARFIYYKLMSLPLLPSKYYLEAFNFIKMHAQNQHFWIKFQPFFEYFQSFWIPQVIFRRFCQIL